MEKNNVNQAKETVNQAKENVKDAAKAAERNLAQNKLTTKQKVIMGLGFVASAATGGAIGYVVGRRKKSEKKDETQELE